MNAAAQLDSKAGEASPGDPKHPRARRRALRVIAIFEAIKGVAVLAASIGLLGLLHHDLRHLVEALIGRFGLDPGAHYPSILLHEADVLQDANVRTLVLMASGYVIVRLAEAYGLWMDKAWAEWLGALSGAIYIPVELEHLVHRTTFTNALVLTLNVAVVIYLLYRLWYRRKEAGLKKAAAQT